MSTRGKPAVLHETCCIRVAFHGVIAARRFLPGLLTDWRVFHKWRWPCLHRSSKRIPVDKHANDDVVYLD
jgi:hypothetical protein